MEPTGISTESIESVNARAERNALIRQTIDQSAEIARQGEVIRRLEHMANYYETRTALLTQVQVIAFSTGEASQETKAEAFEEILTLLQTDARA